jgi:hypothetical protein
MILVDNEVIFFVLKRLFCDLECVVFRTIGRGRRSLL